MIGHRLQSPNQTPLRLLVTHFSSLIVKVVQAAAAEAKPRLHRAGFRAKQIGNDGSSGGARGERCGYRRRWSSGLRGADPGEGWGGSGAADGVMDGG